MVPGASSITGSSAIPRVGTPSGVRPTAGYGVNEYGFAEFVGCMRAALSTHRRMYPMADEASRIHPTSLRRYRCVPTAVDVTLRIQLTLRHCFNIRRKFSV
jgi:hypothetical protein